MSALFVGATTVILPHWDAREWLRLVDAASRDAQLHDAGALHPHPRSSRGGARARSTCRALRLIVHGAAPCPVDGEAAHHRRAAGDRDLGAVRRERRRRDADRAGRVARAAGQRRAAVARCRGPDPRRRRERCARRATPGSIYIQPPGGARFHYHDDPEKTEQAWRDGAFTVGDIGYVDDDGYLFLTDRASDMVIRGGVNVYPREIEEVLFTHPAVVDCAVFGIPDDALRRAAEGGRRDPRAPSPRKRCAAFVPGAPRRLQGARRGRARRRAAAPPQRQGDEALAPGAGLGRPRPRDRLTVVAEIVLRDLTPRDAG